MTTASNTQIKIDWDNAPFCADYYDTVNDRWYTYSLWNDGITSRGKEIYHYLCRSEVDSMVKSGQLIPRPSHTDVPETSKEVKNKPEMVNSPNHYQFFDIEAIDIIRELLTRWEDESDVKITYYQAGCLKEMLQYVLRAPRKNKKEDMMKAVYYMNEFNKEWKE